MSHRILLIDPDPSSAESIKQPLAEAGYDVRIVSDGYAGLEIFLRLQPDMAVIEETLPDRPGLDLCADMKGTLAGKSVPVVVLSAQGSGGSGLEETKAKYGCDLIIEKPVQQQELLAICKQLLPGTGSEDATADPSLLGSEDLDQAIENLDLLISTEELAGGESQGLKDAEAKGDFSQIADELGGAKTDSSSEVTPEQALHILSHQDEASSFDKELNAAVVDEILPPPSPEQPEQNLTDALGHEEEPPSVEQDKGADIEAHLDSLFSGQASGGGGADADRQPVGIEAENLIWSEAEGQGKTDALTDEAVSNADLAESTTPIAPAAGKRPRKKAGNRQAKWWLVAALQLVVAVGVVLYFLQPSWLFGPQAPASGNSSPKQSAAIADSTSEMAQPSETTPASELLTPTVSPQVPAEDPLQAVAEPAAGSEMTPAPVVTEHQDVPAQQPQPLMSETAAAKPAAPSVTSQPKSDETPSEPGPVARQPQKTAPATQPEPAAETATHEPLPTTSEPVKAQAEPTTRQAEPLEEPGETPVQQEQARPATEEPSLQTPPESAGHKLNVMAAPPKAEKTPPEPQIEATAESQPEPIPMAYTPPKANSMIAPVFTPKMLKTSADDEIVLSVLIDEMGRVVRIMVREGTPGSGPVTAAIDAVLRTSYSPATEGDKPVRAWVTESFTLGN